MENFYINIAANNLGKNTENLKCLLQGIKFLPNNLKNFTLHMSGNKLGENSENMKIIGEGMKYIPNNL